MKIKDILGVLSILCLLAAFSIMFDVGWFPFEDKLFLTLFFTALMFITLCCYLDTKSWEIYDENSAIRRKSSMRGLIVGFISCLVLIGMTIFCLP